jgi:sulfatase modifying factor 1
MLATHETVGVVARDTALRGWRAGSAVKPAALLAAIAGTGAVACTGLLGIDGDYTLYDGGSGSGSGGDAGADGGADGGVCTPGNQQCTGTGVVTCGANARWGPAWPCATDACSSGACAGSTTTAESCAHGGTGMTDCVPDGVSCCTSLEVPGGTYDRSYDGIGYTGASSPATVSGLRLDRYEVTVGRFRQFVNAVVSGWQPAKGSGLHAHLNGGLGLSATGGGYETGWDASWTGNLATTVAGWNMNLGGGTWTQTAGSGEDLPITEPDWYEAYAFCIWDGGFLPSEAEWNFAAAGGSEQRAYPWSPPYPPGSTSITCAQANYSGCPAASAFAVGTDSPAGDGKWGQSDLAGNAWEWTADWYASYVTPCADCANLTVATNRVIRGQSFYHDSSVPLASLRGFITPTTRYDNEGFRCARTP